MVRNVWRKIVSHSKLVAIFTIKIQHCFNHHHFEQLAGKFIDDCTFIAIVFKQERVEK